MSQHEVVPDPRFGAEQPRGKEFGVEPRRAAKDQHEAGLVLRAEELNVTTERVVTERVILRRRVVVEEQTITVPVRREVIEVVREPASGDADELGTPAFEADAFFDEGEHDVEMIAHTEVPVVSMQVVPIERVRVLRHAVRDEVPVSAEVSYEQAAVEHLPVQDTSIRH